MFDRGARPDSVFCAAGDTVALGFMKEARRLGIKVPGDIAVVGYDDILAASMVSPSLTTIRQPIIKMGMEALSIILRTLNNEIKETVTTTFEPELIVRESA
jgi:DNA-binding LacI/PurR family transcriptional regulator